MDTPEPEPEQLIAFDVSVDDDRHATVTLAGELDASTLEPLEASVHQRLAAGVSALTVDASQLTFADSSAIALWVRWAASVERFTLRDPPPLLRRVISTMGLDQSLGLTS